MNIWSEQNGQQTSEHILQTCPHPETVHQQFWPEDTEVVTKL